MYCLWLKDFCSLTELLAHLPQIHIQQKESLDPNFLWSGCINPQSTPQAPLMSDTVIASDISLIEAYKCKSSLGTLGDNRFL